MSTVFCLLLVSANLTNVFIFTECLETYLFFYKYAVAIREIKFKPQSLHATSILLTVPASTCICFYIIFIKIFNFSRILLHYKISLFILKFVSLDLQH